LANVGATDQVVQPKGETYGRQLICVWQPCERMIASSDREQIIR
jgi:hypothetical protein